MKGNVIRMTGNNESIKLNETVETSNAIAENETFNATVDGGDNLGTTPNPANDNVEVFQSTVTGGENTFGYNPNPAGDIDNDTATISAVKVITSNDAANDKMLKACIDFFKAGDNMQKRGMAIKMIALAIIDSEKLYTAKGYTSTFEMAEKEFDLNNQTTRSYLYTAQKFYNLQHYIDTVKLDDLVDTDGNFKKAKDLTITSILADESGNDFTPSALEAMRSINIDTLKKLLEDGVIKYSMSARPIKEILKNYRQKAKIETIENDVDVDDNSNGDSENTFGYNPNSLSEMDNPAGDNDTNTGNAEIVKMRNIHDKLKSTIAKLQVEKVQISEDSNAVIERLKAEIARLTAENESLRADNAALENENQRLIENAMTQTAQIESLQSDNENLKNSNNSYKAANSKARKVNDTLKAENATLKAENDTLKSATSTSNDSTFGYNPNSTGGENSNSNDTNADNANDSGTIIIE